MTFKEKRRNKKLSKVYMTLAYVFTIGFALSFVFFFASMINNIEIPVGWALILFITPFITSLGFAISSEYYAAQRKIYKAGIRVYREYKRFNKVLEFLEAGKIEEADDLIDSFAQNSDFRIFLKGHILAYKLKGDNIIDEKYAHQKMEELKETFSPYNVKFE